MDINNIKRIAFLRFLELTVSSSVISSVLVFLNVSGYITSARVMGGLLFAGSLIFLAYNIIRMRTCYIALRDQKLYYISNIAGYLCFGIVSFIVYFAFGMKLYTWFYGIARALRYLIDSFGNPAAVIVFHILNMAAIYLSTLGAKWIFRMPVPEEENENEEML